MKSKRSGLIGLYSGREIKTSAARQSALTRSQTGKQALSAIVAKYGQIVDNAKYYHVGKGEWKKYSLENDKKRTGKLAPNKEVWRQRPHKLDFTGIDTKMGGVRKTVNISKPKRSLSVTSLKTTGKLTGRSTKTNLKHVGKPVLKTVTKPKKKINLSSAKALSILGSKKLAKRSKTGREKGYQIDYDGQKATVTSKGIQVFAYDDGVPTFKYTMTLQEWEKARSYKEDPRFWKETLIKSKFPNTVSGSMRSAYAYNHMVAIDQAFMKYQNSAEGKAKINATLKKEPGTFEHFGKNLKKGDYKDDFANLRSGITKVLKEKYPGQLFMIVAKGYYNNEADVYWTGGPSEAEVRKLGLGIQRTWLKLNNDEINRDVYWHRETPDKLRKLINGVEHNKALKTKAKVSYTRKLKQSDTEAPKPVVKMPAKIPTKTPAAVPKKTIKGRKIKILIPIEHQPVLKSGKPKPKVYKGFLVTGDTYVLKNTIKSMGGKWNADRKGWVVPPSSAKAINKLKKEKKLSVTSLKTEEDVFRRLTESERLDLRKEKYERKAERWGKSAAKLSKESEQSHKQSHDLIDAIPFGQPILVGHYSEKSDRNRRDKAWNLLGKAVHASDAAEEKGRKASVISHVADRLGTTSDLQGRIQKLTKELNHARNKAAHTGGNAAEVKYWTNRANAIKSDIDSLEARLPAEAKVKPTYGVTVTMLGGAKLKPLVGATSITRRYHNKNLKGGNFAVEVRKGNGGVELNGYHNVDGIIYNLRVGPLYGIGVPVITQENYKEYTLDKLVTIVKRAMEAGK